MIQSDKVFLTDGISEFAYADLCRFIENSHSYFPTIKTDSIRDYFFNLVLALVWNKNVTLLDADLTPTEIASIKIDSPSAQEKLPYEKSFASLQSLIEAVRTSDSAITLFTSGTTGVPKKISHKLSTLTRGAKISPAHNGNVWALAYNPTHIAGLQVFLQAFLNGNEIVNIFGKDKKDIFGIIDAKRISHISATPTFFRLLLSERLPHFSVKRITCGGEKSDALLYDNLSRIFPNAKTTNIYASTEFGTLLVSNGEFFEIKSCDADKIKIENNELLVRSDLLGISDAFNHKKEWYRTGDIVTFADPQQKRFKFAGRDSNILNVGGYMVNLEEVEDAIRLMPQVSDTVVYGRENSVTGNIVCADIMLRQDEKLSTEHVRNFLEEKLQYFKIPRIVNFVESMEQTKSGKIKR